MHASVNSCSIALYGQPAAAGKRGVHNGLNRCASDRDARPFGVAMAFWRNKAPPSAHFDSDQERFRKESSPKYERIR